MVLLKVSEASEVPKNISEIFLVCKNLVPHHQQLSIPALGSVTATLEAQNQTTPFVETRA